MDYALDHSAHVTTSAWLDGNGAIEENVHLLSALSLENIRVNEYRNDFGYMETVIIDAPRSDISLWETCPVTSVIKKKSRSRSQKNPQIECNGKFVTRSTRNTGDFDSRIRFS